MTGAASYGVLVVDDDFMVADIHRRVVDRVDGFRTVAVARSGAEALDLVAEHSPDLILLDVYLPDITGLEVLQPPARRGELAGVIMITAARELDTVSGRLRRRCRRLPDQAVRILSAASQTARVRRAEDA